MKKLLFLLPLLAIIGCTNSDNPYNAKFNNSGCLECDNYTAGESFIVGGVRYEVADRTILETAIADGDDLTRYCTSRIGDMSGLFGNISVNQDISTWDVSNVTSMVGMFAYSSFGGMWGFSTFNQDIGNWDVSSVTNMDVMFFNAYNFNQDLTQWCVSNISSMPADFSTNSALTASNYPVWGTCP